MTYTLNDPLTPPQQINKPLLWVKRIAVGIVFAVLLFVLFIFATLAADRVFNHKAIPSVFGYSPLVVMSGSMEPEFYRGDLIIIKAEDSYEAGDIVTYLTTSVSGEVTTVTHRIINSYVQNGVQYFELQGDNNTSPDANPVRSSQVVGRVVGIVPEVGTFLQWLQTPSGIILVILFICIIIAAVYIFKA